MAQLPWVRMDTGIPQHSKILQLVNDGAWRAIAVWHFSIEWCGANNNGGFVPSYALAAIHARRVDMEKLVTVGLLDMAQGGWQLHNYDEKQHVDDAARKRSEHASTAAQARWDKEKKRNRPSHIRGV